MDKLAISIIIPAYNEERYLGACLDAIAALTLQPYEVVVVDNASSDRTAEVARRYPFVRLVAEPRRGRAFAQQTGFDVATGTILARIDADAIVPADWTQQIMDYFTQPGALQTAWTGGPRFYNVRFPRLTGALYVWIASQFNRLIVGHPSLWGSNMALPAALWHDIAITVCQQADIHEDLDLAIHLHRHGYAIHPDKHVQVGVQLRPVFASPAQLWAYLELWPRTVRIHGLWTWVLCWPVNLWLFVSAPFFGISERIARLFGRKPLDTYREERAQKLTSST